MSFVSVNFQQTKQLSVYDRAVAFGDGLFTTGCIEQGRLLIQSEHLTRLQDGCARLRITGVDWPSVVCEMNKACATQQNGVLKVIISAGESQRGYVRSALIKPTVIVQTSDYPAHYQQWREQGITVGIADTRLGINPLLAGIKHLNRLEQVLIRDELEHCQHDDLLVADIQGNIVETSSANVFWQLAGQWQTPSLDKAGVNGLIRQKLLAKIDAEKVQTCIDTLADVEAMFICNTVLGLAPVTRFNGHIIKHSTSALSLYQQLNQWIKE
ncbi:aminodeoxychorismate lyase [Thalassotalea sp. Y01]|uniref:aminodeoxychorismate lyase n=1 Tax=Thalassotalea sp. Y01 TaxID=2729613 RepID=UPI00145E225A|nr:aminodeoxychorismate lyase [Thalassotalea sp. Y01]NMP15559.1 aminodeoxychorismate lyase [Thalassotalea sp. Y01]